MIENLFVWVFFVVLSLFVQRFVLYLSDLRWWHVGVSHLFSLWSQDIFSMFLFPLVMLLLGIVPWGWNRLWFMSRLSWVQPLNRLLSMCVLIHVWLFLLAVVGILTHISLQWLYFDSFVYGGPFDIFSRGLYLFASINIVFVINYLLCLLYSILTRWLAFWVEMFLSVWWLIYVLVNLFFPLLLVGFLWSVISLFYVYLGSIFF